MVFSFNYNDRRYVAGDDQVDDSRHFADQYDAQRRSEFLERLFLYRAVRSLSNRLVPSIDPGDDVDPVSVDTLPARVGPEQYRRNLVAVAELARRRDIPLLFLLFNDSPQHKQYVERGISFATDSRYEEAIRTFSIAIVRDSRSLWFRDLARLELSAVYRDLGQLQESRRVLMLDSPHRSLHGGRPVYRDRVYNEIMTDVAEEFDTGLVDAGRALDSDPSYYIDQVHFGAAGHLVVARLLEGALSSVWTDDQVKDRSMARPTSAVSAPATPLFGRSPSTSVP